MKEIQNRIDRVAPGGTGERCWEAECRPLLESKLNEREPMELLFFLDLGHAIAWLVAGIAITMFAKSRNIKSVGVISILISTFVFFQLLTGPSYNSRALIVNKITECEVDDIKEFTVSPPISSAFQDKRLVDETIVFTDRQTIESICNSLHHSESTLMAVKEPYDWRAVVEMKAIDYTRSFLVLTRSDDDHFRTVLEIRTRVATGETIALLRNDQLGKVLEAVIKENAQ